MLDIEKLKQMLSEAGLKVKSVESESRLRGIRPDAVAHAEMDGRKMSLVIEVKERPHLAGLRLAAEQAKRYEEPNRVPMIAAQFLGPNRRALLREMGMGYVDMAGNFYLRAPGIFIEREGKEKAAVEQPKFNPYADKASIILRLLIDESKHPWKVREIAEAGGITAGWASKIVDSMVERGLVEYSRKTGIRLLAWEDMLKEWADFYDWQRNAFHYYYCHAADMQELIDKIGRLDDGDSRLWALGFQAGAYIVSPHATFNQVHLLIDGKAFDAVRGKIERELQLEERKDGANLILVRPYYTSSALFRARNIKNWRVVSDIQLYLDLNRYPLRGREQAEHLLEKVIRPRMGGAVKGERGSKRD